MRKLILFILMIFLLSQHQPVQAKSPGNTGFAIGPNELIFLLMPSENRKIRVLDKNGVMRKWFGDEGPGEEQILFPMDMVYYNHRIYILDKYGPQIKVFKQTGEFDMAFGKDLPKDQKMKEPAMIRISYSEPEKTVVIFVLDPGRKMIMKYQLDGDFIEGLDFPPEHEGYFKWMTSFNVAQDGNIWVTVDSEDSKTLRRVLVYDEAGFPQKDLTITKIGNDGMFSDILPMEDGGYMVADRSIDKDYIYPGSIILVDENNNPYERHEIYDPKDLKYYSPKRIQKVDGTLWVLTDDDMLLKLFRNYGVVTKYAVK